MSLHYPHRIFSLSDCHGGPSSAHPLAAPDVAARLAEAVRSDFSGLQHFDTYGVPPEYHDHIVREALRLHKENPASGATGLFINSAPRTKAHANGEPFYRAEFDECLRIVATPLRALSAVKDSVRRLQVLPNDANELYDGKKEQHRSSYTPRMLADHHWLVLQDIDPFSIPELPEGCTLAYIDRFGNLVLFEHVVSEVQGLRTHISQSVGETLRVKIGCYTSDVQIGVCLSDAEPGSLVMYANDDSIEILRKWHPSWTFAQRLKNSAYGSFHRPQIGEACEIQ